MLFGGLVKIKELDDSDRKTFPRCVEWAQTRLCDTPRLIAAGFTFCKHGRLGLHSGEWKVAFGGVFLNCQQLLHGVCVFGFWHEAVR